MCERDLEAKYTALVSGQTVLESSLHLKLAEHLNAEIGLGTIKDTDSAKDWLKKSFLYQRIKKNPSHYALGKDADQTWEDKVDDLVINSIVKLKNTELVEYEGGQGNVQLTSTEYGDIMSKFYIRQSTVSVLTCVFHKESNRPDSRWLRFLHYQNNKPFALL